MSELAKCPVCGSDDVSVSWDADSQDYAVECSTDSSPWHYKVAGCGPEGAIAAHNTLARHAEIGRLVEALANNRDGGQRAARVVQRGGPMVAAMTPDAIAAVCRRSGVRATVNGRRVVLRGRGREVVWYPARCSAFVVGTTHSAHCATVESVVGLVKDGPMPVRRVSR